MYNYKKGRNEMKLIATLLGSIMFIIALILTTKWTDLEWWKSFVLFILYGMALNAGNFKRSK